MARVPLIPKLMSYCQTSSPVGPLLLAADAAGLRHIEFVKGRHTAPLNPAWPGDEGLFQEPIRQLQAYFAGQLEAFDLPLAPQGTPFQLAVWQRLGQVPYGETISYGELARWLGNPQAARAVGSANRANPMPIVIPCHRVLGRNGKLTGYGGGLLIKRKLLALEQGQRCWF
jgi:methylated-DNA-[protein]-cysteine S-methyltransferase